MGIIEFFRDTLDGGNYVLWVIMCVFFILAIIGYLNEQKYLKNKGNL